MRVSMLMDKGITLMTNKKVQRLQNFDFLASCIFFLLLLSLFASSFQSFSVSSIPLILIEKGERKVRQRFGLSCPEVPEELRERQSTSPLAERRPHVARSESMALSPGTCDALRCALDSASSSSDQVVLGPTACKRLRRALDNFGNSDSLAADA